MRKWLVVLVAVLGVAAAAAAATWAPGDAEEGRVVVVTMLDDGGTMRFEPANVEVRRGDVVRFVQQGTMPHNVEFVRNGMPSGAELGDRRVGSYLNAKGEVYEVRVDDRFLDGVYRFVCTPHASMGMTGSLEVRGDAGRASSSGSGRSAPGAVAGSGAAAALAAPAAAAERPEIRGAQGLQPLEYELDGDTKVFRLTAEKIRWETKEGTLVDAMAYNRMVPGPVIRVTEGDRVRIIVTNGMDEPHTTHWHGLFVPNGMDGVPGISQDPIMPGDSFAYEFTAAPHGTRLYHSHFNAMRQEGSGLYGMFIIEERNAPAVRQSDREEIMLLADGMGYVINGKEFPMIEPIRMQKDERVRVRIANLGAMYHPMHLHGGYFTVIAKDGFPVETPQRMNTISVAPGETWDIVLAPQFGGTWLWHCHVLSHATGPRDADGNDTSAGMIGVVVVEDGETPHPDLAKHRNH